MLVEPTEHHRWLMQFVGEWEMTSKGPGPDGTEATHTIREVVRSLGGLWVLSEWTGDMGGVDMHGVMMIGYDPGKQAYVGSWAGAPMTNIFVYHGQRAGGVLTLDTEGPDFNDPSKIVPFQDIVEMRGPDERSITSQYRDSEGNWVPFMRAVSTRLA